MSAATEKREETLKEHLTDALKGGAMKVLVGHRFVAVETVQGKKGAEQFAHGHDTIRQACDALSAAMQDGALPEFVLDLDQGSRVEIDAHSIVVPQGVNAKVVVLPGGDLEALVAYVGAVLKNDPAARAFKRLKAALTQ